MRLIPRLAGRLMAIYVRLLAKTCRIDAVPADQAVIASWHEANLCQLAAAYRYRRHLSHASFSTRGRRGDVITAILEALPTRTVVLPLPAEGARAEARSTALRLAALAAEGYSPVVTPDGPFGPYRVAKPGAMIVARAAGLPVLPMGLDARPALRLSGRWDRHILPLPFSHISVRTGRLMSVGPRDRLGPLTAQLERELARLADEASPDARKRRPGGRRFGI